MNLSIVFEDAYLIAVAKPCNMLVHHSTMANNMWEELSMKQILKEQLGKTVYPLHRLDRKTSGIVLFVFDKANAQKFQELFLNDQIAKTYHGLVRGFIAENGKIDSPVKGRDANVHKDALTFFKRIETFEIPIAVGPYPSSRYSLVELKPKTGRLHQLRIHMNKISHPLIGDPKYGDRFHNRMFENEFDNNELFLHAKKLQFNHPITGKEIQLEIDHPTKWNKTVQAIQKIKLT